MGIKDCSYTEAEIQGRVGLLKPACVRLTLYLVTDFLGKEMTS